MTLLFIRSLIRVGKNAQLDWRASRLHEVARRTLIASIIALFVSFANILALMILHGLEQGVLCLTCCTVDVTINVITVHWVSLSILYVNIEILNIPLQVTSSPNGKPLRDAKGNTIITSSSDNGSTIQVNSIDKRGSRDKDNIHHYVYSLQEFSEVKPPDPTYDDSPLSPNIRNYTSMHYKNYVVNKDTKDDELSIEACSIQSSQQSLTNKVYK
jgi:hypothetical protein